MDSPTDWHPFFERYQERCVIHCPSHCAYVHQYTDVDDLAVVMVKRRVEDIIASQQRVGWGFEWLEIKSYPGYSRPIAVAKYHFWETVQKAVLAKKAFELEYQSLSIHPMWVEKDQRCNFTITQIEVGKPLGDRIQNPNLTKKKIVVITKSLNEAHNIANFCTGYAWADLILIADGGSTDATKEIARRFPNVRVRDFEQRIPLPDGSFMNPEPAHVNFLIDWAVEEKADWIILDGCDCWPNPKLRQDARRIFEQATVEDRDGIMLYRLYLWDGCNYFPKINEPGQALWAWRPDKVDCHTDESQLTFFDAVMPGPARERCLVLDYPHVCLHYFEPNKKAARYAAWGKPQTPIQQSIYWPPEPLPEWAL